MPGWHAFLTGSTPNPCCCMRLFLTPTYNLNSGRGERARDKGLPSKPHTAMMMMMMIMMGSLPPRDDLRISGVVGESMGDLGWMMDDG